MLGDPRKEAGEGIEFLAYPCGCFCYLLTELHLLPCSSAHTEELEADVDRRLEEVGVKVTSRTRVPLIKQ